ncbi:MAG: cupin domain-containing protein [Chloroflexi bacterium]|nr:MAG: cupin domain-containing protein [Chloroflexota bacterium]
MYLTQYPFITLYSPADLYIVRKGAHNFLPSPVAGAIHHHGATESIIYVVSGHARMRWGERMQFEEDVEPDDFIYVPPFVPRQEINPSPDTPSQWVIVRIRNRFPFLR